MANLNTYDVENQTCPSCNHKGEMVYHQYVLLWTCQECGWNNEAEAA